MQEFAEEYVAKLQPRDERYDTRLGDDFYVSTFPNGVKTWIFLYDVNGFTRRQTLGVYPEMPLNRALEMLYAARRTRSVEKDLMDQGLDGNKLVRQAEESPIDLTARAAQSTMAKIPRPGKGFMLGAATGAITVAAVAAGALWLVLPSPAPQVPVALVETTPSQTPAKITEPAAELPDDVGAASTVEATPAVVADDRMPATPPVVPPAELPETNALAGAQDAAAQTESLSESQLELIQLQREMTGTLAWSQLTSGIVRGEPVDDLGWRVDLSNEPRRVFFFVRVRGMSGANVFYRWSHEGAVIKRDTVRVGEGWHSPAFSSVTLTPNREGQWQVEVMDSEGRSLGVEQFEARLDRIAAVSRP